MQQQGLDQSTTSVQKCMSMSIIIIMGAATLPSRMLTLLMRVSCIPSAVKNCAVYTDIINPGEKNNNITHTCALSLRAIATFF